jgi:hypothetical protein
MQDLAIYRAFLGAGTGYAIHAIRTCKKMMELFPQLSIQMARLIPTKLLDHGLRAQNA